MVVLFKIMSIQETSLVRIETQLKKVKVEIEQLSTLINDFKPKKDHITIETMGYGTLTHYYRYKDDMKEVSVIDIKNQIEMQLGIFKQFIILLSVDTGEEVKQCNNSIIAENLFAIFISPKEYIERNGDNLITLVTKIEVGQKLHLLSYVDNFVKQRFKLIYLWKDYRTLTVINRDNNILSLITNKGQINTEVLYDDDLQCEFVKIDNHRYIVEPIQYNNNKDNYIYYE